LLTRTDYKKVREIVFLKDVFFIAISAFGGPEMHLSLFLKRLVKQKNYITESDLMELNSLCQILPGPSSTQTLTAIAFKIGGPRLAFLSLLIWILPATLLMTIFAITMSSVNQTMFRFIGPMALGFIVMACVNMTKLLKKKTLSYVLAAAALIVAIYFHSPVAFPVALVIGAIINSNFGDYNYIPNNKPLLNIKWANLSLMLLILITVAVVGLYTKSKFPEVSQPLRLFENTYRMGSMVFGGGNVLYSMILTEFVEYKPKQYLSLQEFQTGLGLLQAVPGPTFTIATYANGIAMRNLGYGLGGQLIGCGVGTLAVFLPGTLLIFFLYPIWSQVKTYPIVYRSLDGIIAVSIGFLWSVAVFMLLPVFKVPIVFNSTQSISVLVFIITLLYLHYTKYPSFILVIVTILIGYWL
jgi:chromate transporter